MYSRVLRSSMARVAAVAAKGQPIGAATRALLTQSSRQSQSFISLSSVSAPHLSYVQNLSHSTAPSASSSSSSSPFSTATTVAAAAASLRCAATSAPVVCALSATQKRSNSSFSGRVQSRPQQDWNDDELAAAAAFDAAQELSDAKFDAAETADVEADVEADVVVDDNDVCRVDNYALHPLLRERLDKYYGFTHFFPIQAHSFEPLSQGHDMVARSRTGTGKTLAFLLPILQRLMTDKRQPARHSARVLIMEPTRELARQVADELKKIAPPNIRANVIYGGASYQQQDAMLARGLHILVCTPGRVMDHAFTRGTLDLSNLEIMVLDEADDMLRIGFQQDVEEIISATPPTRQMLLYSATVPSWVNKVAQKNLKDPLYLDYVGTDKIQTSDTVQHKAMAVPKDLRERASVLMEVAKANPGRILVFARTRQDADDLATMIPYARSIHGGRTQTNRESTMRDFRRGHVRMLVATDVAARGLDIPEIDLVVSLYFPDEIESYIHRSGRTGRAGKSGISLILHEAHERSFLGDLERKIGTDISYHYPAHPARDMPEKVEAIAKSIESNTPSQLMLDAAAQIVERFSETKSTAEIVASIMGNLEAFQESGQRSSLSGELHHVAVRVRKRGLNASNVLRMLPGVRFSSVFPAEGGVYLDLKLSDLPALQRAAESLPGIEFAPAHDLCPTLKNSRKRSGGFRFKARVGSDGHVGRNAGNNRRDRGGRGGGRGGGGGSGYGGRRDGGRYEGGGRRDGGGQRRDGGRRDGGYHESGDRRASRRHDGGSSGGYRQRSNEPFDPSRADRSSRGHGRGDRRGGNSGGRNERGGRPRGSLSGSQRSGRQVAAGHSGLDRLRAILQK
jgi:superfamily II DNA/RNA helicase